MAKRCDVCGKEPLFGNNVSHSNRKTNRRWNPNVRKIRTLIKGSPKTIQICSKCLKAGKASPVSKSINKAAPVA